MAAPGEFPTYNAADFEKAGARAALLLQIGEPTWQRKEDFPVPKVKAAARREESNVPKTIPRANGELEALMRRRNWDLEALHNCDICVESKIGALFHMFPDCQHAFCAACMGKHFTEELHGKGRAKLECPGQGCASKATPEDVIRCCKPQDVEHYDRQLMKAFLESQDDFRFCTNPNGCGSGQLHDGGAQEPIMRCTHCQWRTCFTHKEPYHYGFSCEEYNVWQDASRNAGQTNAADEENATDSFLRRNSKKCPRCSALVSKIGTVEGDAEREECDHMTCTNNYRGEECRHEFCWRCLAPFAAPQTPTRRVAIPCQQPGCTRTFLHAHHRAGCVHN